MTTNNAPSLDADALAQEIRRVDGDHSLGAGALAEALMPFLLRHYPPATPADADPLQVAADWLLKATPDMQPETLAGLLLIGFNRADRLLTAARRRMEGGVMSQQNQTPEDRARDALEWYGSMANRMGKAALHQDSQAMLALMKELAVDYGKRARDALKDLP